MEQVLFRRPTIIAAFQDGFIEARLHTDVQDEKLNAEIRALQQRLAGNRSLPTFIALVPETEKELARHVGLANEEEFLEFLSQGRP